MKEIYERKKSSTEKCLEEKVSKRITQRKKENLITREKDQQVIKGARVEGSYGSNVSCKKFFRTMGIVW